MEPGTPYCIPLSEIKFDEQTNEMSFDVEKLKPIQFLFVDLPTSFDKTSVLNKDEAIRRKFHIAMKTQIQISDDNICTGFPYNKEAGKRKNILLLVTKTSKIVLNKNLQITTKTPHDVC